VSKGIFTAVSGAIAQTARLDTIANNLANVNTPGFKKDSQLFKEYLTSYEKEPGTITVPRIPASIESFYDVQGGDKSYVDLDGTFTDFSQGSLKQTGNSLDCALEGDGFYEVLAPEGVRLTRNGDFNLDSEGKLVTKQGFPVLSAGTPGQDPAGRVIKLADGKGNVTVSPNGEIFEGATNVAKLSILTVTNKDSLQKTGQNLYGFRDNLQPDIVVATEAKVHQGWVEGSNVNPVKEMTEMIAATRTFETTQKAIQAYDSMAGKAANDISKLQG
jgi:flagellar basal-body rod protein FlgF